jgi:hypothetical protein
MANDNIRVAGNYTAQWLSLHSDLLRPVVLPTLYKTYGRGFDYLDFLSMAGKNGLVAGRTVNLWEQGNIKSTITTATAIVTAGVGAQITFKIAAGNYDTNTNPVLRTNQVVYIPSSYQPAAINVPQNYLVTGNDGGTPGDLTFTAKPLNNGAAQIATEIPIGTELSLGPILYAPGMGLPESTTQAAFKRTFITALMKEKLAIEGGFLSQQYWEPFEQDGKLMGYTNKLLIDTEFLLDDQLNQYIGFGQTNDNSAIVQTSTFGGSNKVLSGIGIWPALDANAQQLWYADAFENQDYKAAKNYFESQGVVDTEVIFCSGSDLFDDAEQSDLDYIKEYSGGSDLLKNMNQLGFPIAKVYRNGLVFNKVKLKSLSNPFSMGNAVYGLSKEGFMMPTTKAKVTAKADGSTPVYLNNIELRFLGRGAENRTRVLGELNGISGIDGQAVNEYDGKVWGMLTEPMLILTNLNQVVQVRKEA